MKHPRVSIGLPVFNGANYLRAAIESILAQDYHDLELIIADNASTDDTEAICRAFAGRDQRVRYYRNEKNLGAAGNYNKVFALARGEYFKWAAHDDECHPAMIRRCVATLEIAPPSVTMVYPLAELIDEHGKTLAAPLDRIEARNSRPHQRLAHLLRELNMCDPVFGLFRSSYLKQTQLIGPFFGADYVLLGELAMLGEIREINEVLFRLRAHPQRSMKAHASKRERAAWYDPAAAARRFTLSSWERMVWELLKSAAHFPLPFSDKVRCCAMIPTVYYLRSFRNIGGRWKARLKAGLGLKPVKRVAAPPVIKAQS